MAYFFEQTGWSRIDIGEPALDLVEPAIESLGITVEKFALEPHLAGFQTYLQLPDYAGDYQIYGGKEIHCLWEKSLEHYLSFVLAAPQSGQVGIDIGSCQSVVPGILRRVFKVRCYEQDLTYPAGVQGDTIGSSADSIPLPDASVDFMVLHCTFEHFEGDADTGFVRECARLLKPGGRVVILPLYLNANYCNVTGVSDLVARKEITFDPHATHYNLIPEWQNRFGRHYSPEALHSRVLQPARESGLHARLLRVSAYDRIDPRLWLRWILILTKETPASATASPTKAVMATPGPTPDLTTARALAFAPPGHFYSPHPQLEELERTHATILARSESAAAINLNVSTQLQLLQKSRTTPTGPWTNELVGSRRYHYNNVMFRFGDANALWQIAQEFKPQQVIEVGSGYSTACWLDSFDALGLSSKLICIEPYPDRVLQLCRTEDLAQRITLHKSGVQQIPVSHFAALKQNDVLFIDSTHVAKCGSDVNYLFFDVLPALAPGVIVHVHDIFWPFDYPLSWYREGRAWNESFLLRAFLQYNEKFEIIRFNSFLAQRHAAAFDGLDQRFCGDAGGSIWLRKKS